MVLFPSARRSRLRREANHARALGQRRGERRARRERGLELRDAESISVHVERQLGHRCLLLRTGAEMEVATIGRFDSSIFLAAEIAPASIDRV
jgi:hypothetical protein